MTYTKLTKGISESYRVLGICLGFRNLQEQFTPHVFEFPLCAVLGAGGLVLKNSLWVVMMLL